MSERKYLFEATTAGGGRTLGHVNAISVSDARQKLTASGHSEVVIHDSDFDSQLRADGERQTGIDRPPDLEIMLKRDPSPLRLVKYMMRKNWIWLVAEVALLVWFAFIGLPAWGWAIVAVFVAYEAYLYFRAGRNDWLFREVYRAFWAGDWERCKDCAQRVRATQVAQKSDVTKLEMDMRFAASLVMQGRAQEGFSFLDPWRSNSLYPGKIVTLCYYARDFAGALAAQEKVFAEKGNDTARIDLAQYLARLGDDDARATELLDALNSANIVPTHATFIALCRGVIALKAGDNPRALRELTVAIDGFQEIALNPVAPGITATCCGYLAVALSRSGDRKRAIAFLEPLRAVVERHAEDRLRAWLRAEGLSS